MSLQRFGARRSPCSSSRTSNKVRALAPVLASASALALMREFRTARLSLRTRPVAAVASTPRATAGTRAVAALRAAQQRWSKVLPAAGLAVAPAEGVGTGGRGAQGRYPCAVELQPAPHP